MRILLDTNALASNAQRTRRDHAEVSLALRKLVADGWDLCVCNTVVYELWAFATRPNDGGTNAGFGWSPRRAAEEIDKVLATVTLLPEPADMLTRWRAFCVSNEVKGKRSHDARVAVSAVSNQVRFILTQNVRDFSGWEDVEPIAPETV